MVETCSRDHCEYAPEGICTLWPHGWCPHIAERQQAAAKIELNRRSVKEYRKKQAEENGRAQIESKADDKRREYQKRYRESHKDSKRVYNRRYRKKVQGGAAYCRIRETLI